MNNVLIVIEDPATNAPIIYGRELTDEIDILQAVEEFFEEKDIRVDYEVVEHITDALEKGKHFWYDEHYCFQIVNIYR